MCQFVSDQVLREVGFQHRHPPIEAQRTVGRTAPPPLALVPDDQLELFAPAEAGAPPVNASLDPCLCPAAVPGHSIKLII